MDGNGRLAPILRRSGSHEHVRAFVIELDISPNELSEFPETESGVGRGEVEQALLVGGGDELGEFLVRECTATLLLSAHIHLGDLDERIPVDASLSLHPVEHRVERIEILVGGFGAEFCLFGSPADELVGRDVANDFPAAAGQEPSNPDADMVAVGFRASKGVQVRQKVLQVGGEYLLRRVPLKLGGDEAGAFAFLLPDEVGEFLLGDLLIGGVEAYLGDGKLPVETVARVVRLAGRDVSASIAAAFEDVGDHRNVDGIEILAMASPWGDAHLVRG